MSERNLNFEQGVDRKGTRCLKYDFAVQRGRSADILPLWVADMDFKTSSYIQDALLRQAEHGVYGYTETDETYFDAVRSWMERRHGWKIEPEWLLKTPGVVFALAMAVKAYTEPGDYVLIQEPVYYPFREVIESNDREVANNVLYQDENGNGKLDTGAFGIPVEKFGFSNDAEGVMGPPSYEKCSITFSEDTTLVVHLK